MKFFNYLATLFSLLFIYIGSIDKTIAAEFRGLGELQDGVFRSSKDVSADGSTVIGISYSKTDIQQLIWDSQNGVREAEVPQFDDSLDFADQITRLSQNGITIARYSSNPQERKLFIWSSKEGFKELTQLPNEHLTVKDISDDASVVIGYRHMNPYESDKRRIFRTEAMIWRIGSEIKFLGQPENAYYDSESFYSRAMGVSADGSTVVGLIGDRFKRKAFIWNEVTGMQEIGDLEGGKVHSLAWDISADGSTVIGKSASTNSFNEAFIWTKDGGMQGLGDLPGGVFESYAHVVSGDGSVVLGQSTSGLWMEVFIWDEKKGMRSLKSALTEEYNLDLRGWHLSRVTGISDDGSTIVGNGWNPQGESEAWIVNLK